MPDPRTGDRPDLSRRELIFLAVWTVVAGAAYLYQIDARSLWLDEVMSLSVAARSLPEMWSFFQGLPEQHPFYYLLLGGWVELFGTGELAVRSLSAVFAVGGGWLSYFLARRLFGKRVAFFTAAILLVSPFWLYFAQEARMYTLLGFLAVASHLLYLRWREDDGGGAWWAYILVGVLGAYTHLFFLFVPLAHLVVAAEEHRDLGPKVRRRAAAVIAIGMAYLPWAWLILTHMPEGQGWKGAQHLVLGLPYTLFRFSVGYSELVPVAGWKQDAMALLANHGLMMAAVFLCFGVLLVVGGGAALRRGRAGRFLLLGAAVPVVGMYALSSVTVLVGERYQVVIFPLFVILLALAVDELVFRGRSKRALLGCALAAAALVLSVNSLVGHYGNDLFAKADWRAAAEFVAERAEPGDRVIFHEDFGQMPFEYYYHRLDGPELGNGRAPAPPSGAGGDGYRLWVIVSHAPAGSECASSLGSESEDIGGVPAATLHHRFPSGAGIDVFLLEFQHGATAADRGALFAEVTGLCPS